MCSLRDAATGFEAAGVRVFGISLDDVNSQAGFVEEQELNFPLLSDPDGSVAGKFGVMMAARPYARRVTFVVDPEGLVRLIDDEVDVREHGADLVRRIRQMQR